MIVDYQKIIMKPKKNFRTLKMANQISHYFPLLPTLPNTYHCVYTCANFVGNYHQIKE